MLVPNPTSQRHTTTALLHDVLDAHPEESIPLEALLTPLRARAFGVLLLILAIPNFIPIPIGIGAIMGVLVALLGLQMLCGMERPFIPVRWRHKMLPRRRVQQFLTRSEPLTRWLERWCKPRLAAISGRPWSLVSGLALMTLGTLLALPIPFTNYLFGVVLLTFAFALIERDGATLVALWVVSAVLLAISIAFSNVLVDTMQQVVHHFM